MRMELHRFPRACLNILSLNPPPFRLSDGPQQTVLAMLRAPA